MGTGNSHGKDELKWEGEIANDNALYLSFNDKILDDTCKNFA